MPDGIHPRHYSLLSEVAKGAIVDIMSVTEALGIELRAADHQRHHVQGSVNFSKRFSLFDRLFGTWAPRDRPRGLKVIDLAEAPAEAYPVVS